MGATPEPTPTPATGTEPTPTPTRAPASLGGASDLVVRTPILRLARMSSTPMTGVPAIVSWSLAGGQAGVGHYDLQSRRDRGRYTTIALTSPRTTSRAVNLLVGHTYNYRVRAVDRMGRVGAWKVVGPVRGLRVSDASSSMTWSGAWSSVNLRAYIGGRARWTKFAGATATLRFHGTSVAWVGPVGPTRGKAQVYLDGRLVTAVDLRAATFSPRRIVFAASIANGSHTLVMKALGTAGRPTVAVDAIYVVGPS